MLAEAAAMCQTAGNQGSDAPKYLTKKGNYAWPTGEVAEGHGPSGAHDFEPTEVGVRAHPMNNVLTDKLKEHVNL